MQEEGALCIDAPTCAHRLSRLFSFWEQTPVWAGACHALVCAVGLEEHNDWDELLTSRARALQAWLLGVELGDSLLAFVRKEEGFHEVHVLASQKKAAMLLSVADHVGSQHDDRGPQLRVIVHVKPKDEDGASQAKEFLEALGASKPEDAQAFIGTLVGEKHKGPLVDVYSQLAEQQAKAGALCFVDITAGCDELLRVKEAEELRNHKKAALLAMFVMRDCLVAEMEAALARKKRSRNIQIAEMAEEAIREPETAGIKLNSENCDLAYPAQIQSSGKFNFKVSAGSYKTHLHAGVIVASLGTRYNMYSGNISRTYLVDPTLKQMREYELLLEAQRAACRSLMDGAHPDSVADAVLRVFQRRGQQALLQKLSPSLGHGLGLIFKESTSLSLNKQGNQARPISAGQVYNVCLSLNNLTDLSAAAPNKTYSMQLADTVVVGEGKRVQVVTMKAPKDIGAVVYTFEQDAPAPAPAPPPAPLLPLKRPRHVHCSSAASSGGSSVDLPSSASHLESLHNCDVELLATEI